MKPGDPEMIMVGQAFGAPVMRAVSRLPGRKLPRMVGLVYAELLCQVARDTGELVCDLGELAKRMRLDPAELGTAIVVLARLRVIVRDPRAAGDAWFINPHLAWAGSLEARARFAALVPPPDVRLRGR